MKSFIEYLAEQDLDIDSGIQMFLKIANDSLLKGEMAQLNKDRNKKFVAKKLRKYTAIYNEEFGKITSIHAFIDNATGDLLKPAGFKAPAKGARGNITNPDFMQKLKSRFDPYGSYLYAR